MARVASPRSSARATPRRRPAGGWDDPARLALEAFDPGAALVDLAHQQLTWCSPGFSSFCCVEADDEIDRAEVRLPGLRAALAGLAPPAAFGSSSDADEFALRKRWQLDTAAAPTVVEVALVQPGLAAVRLRRAAAWRQEVDEEAQATRRHLEDRERLLFTSRALAVGEMASTLAHELNQPIGTVTNVLRGMRARLERQGDSQDLLGVAQLALEQALFASRVIARIREYTHSRQPARELLDLVTVVRDSLALLDWELQRDSVQLLAELGEQPCPIEGDEVMLQQLFVNLLRNALDAMRDNPPDGQGRTQRQLSLRLNPVRDMAVLTVRDNGCGLPKDADQQLFVPFQSTKPNGMGIGLNICRSFVELHQGRLWFSPNDGDADGERGCSFHVALPLRREGKAPRVPRSPA